MNSRPISSRHRYPLLFLFGLGFIALFQVAQYLDFLNSTKTPELPRATEKLKEVNLTEINPDTLPKHFSKLPSLLLIGVQKGGTTALAQWLSSVFCYAKVFEKEPPYYKKEVHFFDEDSRFKHGIDFYVERFGTNSTCGLYMDGTPGTFGYVDRVRSIYEEAGQATTVKLILILRDPVARQRSLHNHMSVACKQGHELCKDGRWASIVKNSDGSIMSFNEYLKVITPMIRKCEDNWSDDYSNWTYDCKHIFDVYDIMLQPWLDHFSRDQLLVLSYDELSTDPQKVHNRIQLFLGHKIHGDMGYKNTNGANPKDKVIEHVPEELELISALEPHIKRFYEMMDAHPGPPMEQRPFPKFEAFQKN